MVATKELVGEHYHIHGLGIPRGSSGRYYQQRLGDRDGGRTLGAHSGAGGCAEF